MRLSTILQSSKARHNGLSLLLVLLLLATSSQVFAQLEQRYWMWGEGNTPGNIEFFPNAFSPWTGNTPPNPLPNFGFEGTGVATDPATGTLLFYTDGNEVYDAAHNLLINNLGGDPSSGQPVALCVVPNCPFDTFYIFSNSTGTFGTVNQGPITYRTFNSVTQTFSAQQSLPPPYDTQNMAEGMIVVPNPNNPLEFWLLAHELSSNRYPVFRIDGSGVALQAVYTFGPAYTSPQGIGNMSFTPVSFNNNSVGEVAFIHSATPRAAYSCQFDATTGAYLPASYLLVSNFSGLNGVPYDVEWSPNGRFFYFSTYFRTNIWQYDMSTATTLQVTTGLNNRGGGIKLGPDGRIYHIINGGPAPNSPGAGTVAAITTPNLLQSAGGFNYNSSVFSFTNVFGYNFPEFITRPNWSATVNVQGGDSICPGESVLLTTTVNVTGTTPVSYQWFNGGTAIPGATSPTYTVTTPGTYHIVVQLSIGCEVASVPVTIFAAENCCFAADDPQFTQILSNVTYNTYTTWSGKVYVGPGVTVTVDNATLDLSNVDVVFGPCAGIDFINSAEIRANNSVFRPCNPLDSWRGFEFRDGADGTINESTFKNAWNALNFLPATTQPPAPSQAKISNNLFSNCRTAITSTSNAFNAPITGNTFLVDDAQVDYAVVQCGYTGGYANDHYGIRGLSSSFSANISQNDFVNGSEPDNNKQFFGIHIANGMANLSKNTFTNMWRSIDFLKSFASNIENNYCEVNRHFGNRENQIRIAESSGINVTGNELIQAVEATEFTNSQSGIYVENSSTIYVHENEVDGFALGIAAFRISASSIGENEITAGGIYGIYGEDCVRLDIVCNRVQMAVDEAIGSVGIGYIQFDAETTSIQIRGNCVFDTRTAILLFSQVGANMPYIRNNYLYSYVQYGIQNMGFTGSIGTGAGSFGVAGRNTFVSNNLPNGALDVNSTVGITVGGNWGISAVSGGVAVVGNNVYHSTAACGHQIGNPSQELSADEDCDLFKFGSQRLIGSGGMQPSQELLDLLRETAPTQKLEVVKGALAVLSRDHSPAELESFLWDLASTDAFSEVPAQLQAGHYLATLTGNEVQAATALNAFSPNSPEQTDWKRLESWLLALRASHTALTDLTDAELAFLQPIGEAGHRYADVARDYLQLARGQHDYRFKPASVFEKTDPASVVELDEDFLEAFPNPASDQVQVRYHVAAPEGLVLEVVDVLGRVLAAHHPTANSTTMQVDLSKFKTGVYFLVLRDGDARIASQKVLKL